MRMPRKRSALTASWMPCAPQSMRPLVDSPDTNSRLRYTDTSLCMSGQMFRVVLVGCAGSDTSHTWKPRKLPWMT
jgi:hypothetical protein